MQLLKQPQYHPMKQYEQVFLLVAATERTMQGIPVTKIREFAEKLLQFAERKDRTLCMQIEETGILSGDDRQKIIDLAQEYVQNYLQAGEGQGE